MQRTYNPRQHQIMHPRDVEIPRVRSVPAPTWDEFWGDFKTRPSYHRTTNEPAYIKKIDEGMSGYPDVLRSDWPTPNVPLPNEPAPQGWVEKHVTPLGAQAPPNWKHLSPPSTPPARHPMAICGGVPVKVVMSNNNNLGAQTQFWKRPSQCKDYPLWRKIGIFAFGVLCGGTGIYVGAKIVKRGGL